MSTHRTPATADTERTAEASARPGRRWVAVATLAGVVPILVAGLRAAAGGWRAIGDNANFLIRSRDVLTAHHPLLGTWTSASIDVGVNIDNPGPLYFDLLAMPAKIGDDAGLALGAAGLNALALVGIAVFATRAFGAVRGMAAVGVATMLAWSMGSELLFDPWQPHSLLLPVLLFMFLVAAMAAGDPIALPAAAFVASVIVQTHLSYALLVPALALVGCAGLVLHTRSAPPQHRRRLRRAGGAAVVVLAVSWAQTLYEQVAGPGPGNLGKIISSAGSGGEVHGPAKAARMTAEVLALPPMWLRPSMAEAFIGRSDAGVVDHIELPSLALSLAGLAVLVGLLAALTALRRPSSHRGAVAGVALVAVVLAHATTAIGPVGLFKISPHQVRYLWPIGAFVVWVLAIQLIPAEAVGRARAHRPILAGLLLVTVGFAVAALPEWNPAAGPAADAEVIPVVRALTADLDTSEIEGPVLADLSGMRFAEPWTGPVLAELQRRGIEFRVDDEGLVGQLGPRRRSSGREAVRLFVREGDAALAQPPAATRVGIASALTAADRRRLATLRNRPRLDGAEASELARLEHAANRLTAAVFVAPRGAP